MPGHVKRKEWICTYCGKRTIMADFAGRPNPGNCPRKPKDKSGMMKPHTWRLSRTWE